MIDYLGMVREFHNKYGHSISDEPLTRFNIPISVEKLRDELIGEECEEFADAKESYEIADALADLLYVIFGTALAYGIPIDEVFTEVHRSNMTKSMLKDEKSTPGKTLKGEGYEPPKIREILEARK